MKIGRRLIVVLILACQGLSCSHSGTSRSNVYEETKQAYFRLGVECGHHVVLVHELNQTPVPFGDDFYKEALQYSKDIRIVH